MNRIDEFINKNWYVADEISEGVSVVNVSDLEQLRPYVTLAEWVLVHSVSILDAFTDSKRFTEAMIFNQLMKSTNKSINNQKGEQQC